MSCSRAWILALIVGCAARPTAPPIAPGRNPFEGQQSYVNASNNAARQSAAWKDARPDDAALLEQLARQPVAFWFGDWSGDVRLDVRTKVADSEAQGALPVMVLYNIPNRDCGQYSAGGTADPEAYRRWIEEAKKGIGRSPAVVILEPDALGLLDDCLAPREQKQRLELLADAVKSLGAEGQVAVYIDAGNAKWHTPEVMAERLRGAGIAHARGFALNVSNYVDDEKTIAYGQALSRLLDGKPFVVDTSRNGNGATADAQWCNPSGRAVGHPPTADTGYPDVDAFLWIKVPGESDGECGGGPAAGQWWPEIALELASNARWTREAVGLPPPDAPPPAPISAPEPGPHR